MDNNVSNLIYTDNNLQSFVSGVEMEHPIIVRPYYVESVIRSRTGRTNRIFNIMSLNGKSQHQSSSPNIENIITCRYGYI